MKTGFFFIAGLIFLAACSGEKKMPLLPVDTMVDILQEFHLAKAQIDTDHNSIKYRREETEMLYAAILQKTGVEPSLFSYSYDYYLDHPVLLDTIYVRVIKGLNEKMNREESYIDKKRTADPAANQSPAIDVDKSISPTQTESQAPDADQPAQTPEDQTNRAR